MSGANFFEMIAESNEWRAANFLNRYFLNAKVTSTVYNPNKPQLLENRNNIHMIHSFANSPYRENRQVDPYNIPIQKNDP